MTEPTASFRDFEHQGWQTDSTAAGYHKHFSSVTTQAIELLLDAARIRAGMRVLDVATGAGYAAEGAGRVPLGSTSPRPSSDSRGSVIRVLSFARAMPKHYRLLRVASTPS